MELLEENNQAKKDLMSKLEPNAKTLEPVSRDSDIEKLLKQIGNKSQNNGPSKSTEETTLNDTKLKKIIIQNGIGMKYSDANGLDAATSKNLNAIKANGDVQIQTVNSAAENNQKTVSAAKAALPENPIYKAPIETRVIDQIINRMSVRSNGSQSEVKIKLDPPSLGKVRMNIIMSGDGVRTVIVAENQAVKQVIENNFNQLRDAMGEQGLKLGSFTVTVGGESGHQHPSGESLDEENNTSLFEKTASNDTDDNPETGMVSLFFGDNQSISVIA